MIVATWHIPKQNTYFTSAHDSPMKLIKVELIHDWKPDHMTLWTTTTHAGVSFLLFWAPFFAMLILLSSSWSLCAHSHERKYIRFTFFLLHLVLFIIIFISRLYIWYNSLTITCSHSQTTSHVPTSMNSWPLTCCISWSKGHLKTTWWCGPRNILLQSTPNEMPKKF